MSLADRLNRLTGALAPGTRSHLEPGSRAPHIDVPRSDTGKPLALATLGGRPSLLMFYPDNDGPRWLELVRAVEPHLGHPLMTFGVGRAGLQAQQAAVAQHRLPFPLLSDTRGEVADRYGVLAGLGRRRRPRLAAFVIDEHGRVVGVTDPADPSELLALLLPLLSDGEPT